MSTPNIALLVVQFIKGTTCRSSSTFATFHDPVLRLRFQNHLPFDTHCVCTLQTVRQQLNKDSEEIQPRDPTKRSNQETSRLQKLKIEFQEEVSGWLLSMEPYDREISAKEVDQRMSVEELQLREEIKPYPPKHRI